MDKGFDGYFGTDFIISTDINNVYNFLQKNDYDFIINKTNDTKKIEILTSFEESSEELYFFLTEELNTNNIYVDTLLS